MKPRSTPLPPDDLLALAASRPQSDEQLHAWCRLVLGLDIPRESICPNHNAPFDYVRDAYFQNFTDAVIWANRGGGKTTLGAVVTLLDALWKPGTAVRILGGSLEQSQKMYGSLIRMVRSRFADRLAGGYDPQFGRQRGFTARTLRFDNGSEVEILAQSERSVRGTRVQKMRCDEVELFDCDVWSSCQLVTESREIAPAGAISRGAVEAFSTFHRVGGLMQQIVEGAIARGSPVYRWCVLDVLERCPPTRPCADCPLAPDCAGRAKNATGFYRIDDAIAAKARVSRELWESEMLCLRPSRRGAVFPTFSRARHVAPLAWRPDWPLYRTIDFGFTNPFVCLWVQVSPTTNEVAVLKEYVQSHTTISAHATNLRTLDPGPTRATFCDPAGGQSDQITGTSARAELKNAGIDTRTRPSAITEGLEIIRRHLDGGPIGAGGTGGPTIRIDPGCEKLIAAMEAYRYPEPTAGRAIAELPLKDGVHDHPIDALRYFFVNQTRREGKVIERLY